MTHLLVLRFAIVNLAAVALLGTAYGVGWVDQVVAGDRSHVVFVILAVFLFGLALCARRIWWVSGARDRGDTYTASLLIARIAAVRQTANSLVLLGLIGTVLGFVIAFSGIDAEMIGDSERAAEMISQVIGGMGVALYTTLVGTITHIWLYGCYKILEQAATAAWLGEPC